MLESGVRTCREARMAEDQETAKKTPPPFHIDSLLGRAPSLNHLSSDGRMDENCSQSLACTAALPSSVYAQPAAPPSWIQPNATCTASTDRGKLKSKCCRDYRPSSLQFPCLTHMHLCQAAFIAYTTKSAHCKRRIMHMTRPGYAYR